MPRSVIRSLRKGDRDVDATQGEFWYPRCRRCWAIASEGEDARTEGEGTEEVGTEAMGAEAVEAEADGGGRSSSPCSSAR